MTSKTGSNLLDRFVGVRMPTALVQHLERFAQKEKTSASALVREAVSTLIARREDRHTEQRAQALPSA